MKKLILSVLLACTAQCAALKTSSDFTYGGLFHSIALPSSQGYVFGYKLTSPDHILAQLSLDSPGEIRATIYTVPRQGNIALEYSGWLWFRSGAEGYAYGDVYSQQGVVVAQNVLLPDYGTIPEPEVWALLSGLVCLGYVVYRKVK